MRSRLKEKIIDELCWYRENMYGKTLLASLVPIFSNCVISLIISCDLFIDLPNVGQRGSQIISTAVMYLLFYIPLIYFLALIRLWLRFISDDQASCWQIESIRIIGNLCSTFLRLAELGPLQIKLFSIIMVYYRRGEADATSNTIDPTILLSMILIDFTMMNLTIYFRMAYMTPLFPEDHPKAKIEGASEFIDLALIQVSTAASLVGNLWTIKDSSRLIWIVPIHLSCGVISITSFFMTMMYADKRTLIGYGVCISTFFFFQLEHILLKDKMDQFIIILSLTIPLLTKMIDYLVSILSTRRNFFDEEDIQSVSTLKSILTRSKLLGPLASFLRDEGLLIEHVRKCRISGCICQDIWKALIDSKSIEAIEFVKTLISANILVRFIKRRSNDAYIAFLSSYWFMDNFKVPLHIFGTLEQLKASRSTFKAEYYYRALKKRLSYKLDVLYYSRNLFFTETKHRKMIGKWTDDDLKDITERGVDLAYALRYRSQIKILSDLVSAFSNIVVDLIKVLRKRISKMSDINSISYQLYNLSIKIEDQFKYTERMSKNSDYLHIAPYFVFKSRFENMFESALGIVKNYQNKLKAKVVSHVGALHIQTDINLLQDAIVFSAESCPSKLGIFNDIYGCIDELHLSYDDVIGKSMSYLVMPGFVDLHLESALKFATNEMIPLLGEAVRNSFIYLPKTDYIRPVNYNLKLIPTIESDYQLVIGAKLVEMTSKVFILIAPDNTISGYSLNWSEIFDDPKEYLPPRIHIKEFHERIFTDIKKKEILMISSKSMKSGIKQELKDIKEKDNMVDIFLNMESISSHESKSTYYGKIDNYYIIPFTSRKTGKTVSFGFKTSISFHSYILVDCKYKLISLKLEDEKAKQKLKKLDNSDSNISDFESIKLSEIIHPGDNLLVNEEDCILDGDKSIKVCDSTPQSVLNYTKDYKFISKRHQNLTEYTNKQTNFIDLKSSSKSEKSSVENLKNIKMNEQSSKMNTNIPSLSKSRNIRRASISSTGNLVGQEQCFEGVNPSIIMRAHIPYLNKSKLSFEKVFQKQPFTQIIFLLLTWIAFSFLVVFAAFSLMQTHGIHLQNEGIMRARMIFKLMYIDQVQLFFYSQILEKIALEMNYFDNKRLNIFNFSGQTGTIRTTDYSDLPYNLGDFRNYNRYILKNYSAEVQYAVLDFVAGYESITEDRSALFVNRIKYSRINQNNNIIEEEVPAYDFLLMFQTNQIALAASLDDNTFINHKNSPLLNFFTLNMLERLPQQLESVLAFLESEAEWPMESYSSLLGSMKYILNSFIFFCYLVTIYLVWNFKNGFVDIYSSLLKINEAAFDERIKEINHAHQLLQILADSNYFEDIMKFKSEQIEGDSQRKVGRKIIRRFKDKCNWFGLSNSLIIFSIVFLLLNTFVTVQIEIDSKSVETSLKRIQITLNSNIVLRDEILSYAALMQYIVLGVDSKFNEKPIFEFLQQRINSATERFAMIKTLSVLGLSNLDIKPEYLNNSLRNTEFPSLCDIVPAVIERSELCSLLDDGIPQKGLIQSNYRVNQVLDEFYSQLTTPNVTSPSILGTSDAFTTFSYSLTWLYFPSLHFYSSQYPASSSINYPSSSWVGMLLILSLLLVAIGRRVSTKAESSLYVLKTIGVNALIGGNSAWNSLRKKLGIEKKEVGGWGN